MDVTALLFDTDGDTVKATVEDANRVAMSDVYLRFILIKRWMC